MNFIPICNYVNKKILLILIIVIFSPCDALRWLNVSRQFTADQTVAGCRLLSVVGIVILPQVLGMYQVGFRQVRILCLTLLLWRSSLHVTEQKRHNTVLQARSATLQKMRSCTVKLLTILQIQFNLSRPIEDESKCLSHIWHSTSPVVNPSLTAGTRRRLEHSLCLSQNIIKHTPVYIL